MNDTKTIKFHGQDYFDDRMFVLYLCKGTVELEPDNDGVIWTTIYHEEEPLDYVWCLATYRNCIGYPLFSIVHFKSKEAAITYMNNIEPETPLISLNGRSPYPPASHQDYLLWKVENKFKEFDFRKVYSPGGTNAKELIGITKEQFKGII